ncbi:MAG: hypothetical protein ACOC44_01545 [Promethearchaeia archaeon]
MASNSLVNGFVREEEFKAVCGSEFLISAPESGEIVFWKETGDIIKDIKKINMIVRQKNQERLLVKPALALKCFS